MYMTYIIASTIIILYNVMNNNVLPGAYREELRATNILWYTTVYM